MTTPHDGCCVVDRTWGVRARRRVMRAWWIAPMSLALLVACGGEAPPHATATSTTVSPAVASAPRNLALGTGEPRDPEPFTLEQRLRDAVERGDRGTIEKALERG